ncbi:MAG: Lrp/AsnC family transcriptional regulator [Candidatus Heimdallarchaeota archaeon]|nr:Lrp/AsnC family transcriptional regulator [Candidatus Heimdallarchaeota archaeon]
MRISDTDYQIILALESDPLMTYSDLSKRLQISWPTAKKHLINVQEKGILRHPYATYYPEKLGLTAISFIIFVSDLDKMQTLEKFFDEFPYSLYRSRFLGMRFGLFVQVNFPTHAREKIDKLIDMLKGLELFEDIHVLDSTNVRYQIYPSLTKFDRKTGIWDFSWEEWVDTIPQDSELEITPPLVEANLDEYNEIHFEILKLLTMDASIKQTEIRKLLNLSKTDTHNHYTTVMNKLVSDIRIRYHRSLINFSDSYLVLIPNIKEAELRNLISHLKSNPPPFRISFNLLSNNSAVIWGTMTNPQAMEFSFAFWRLFPQMEYYPLNVRGSSSRKYYFYPDNFDFSTQSWKISDQYIIGEPISKIKNRIS